MAARIAIERGDAEAEAAATEEQGLVDVADDEADDEGHDGRARGKSKATARAQPAKRNIVNVEAEIAISGDLAHTNRSCLCTL